MNKTPLAARDAALWILGSVERQPTLRVPLDDALGSVLAEPVVSPLDIPAHTNSAMDGYAVRATDVASASAAHPITLRVIEEIAAGAFPARPIAPGECARIFTGAPVPSGADCVIRQEDTDLGGAAVTIVKAGNVGQNLRLAGEDIRLGTQVFGPGTTLGPAQLGVLASLAVAHPVVFRRPRVGILASGDEIVDVDQPEEILNGRKTASSNTHTLAALVFETGGVPVNLGIARDTAASVREHIGAGTDCDLLVTSAGISVGEHDHIRSVMAELGAALTFWRVRMRPGAPVGFGMLGTKPWIGLPGNPVSTMVTFELFVRPAIRKMMGHLTPFRRSVPVRVAQAIPLAPGLQHFLRVVVQETDGGLEARLTGPQGSGILTSMAKANALLIVPEGTQEVLEGTTAQALLLDDAFFRTDPAF